MLNSGIFPHNGEFCAYRELPSGDLYDKPFQGRCIFRLNRKYGNQPELSLVNVYYAASVIYPKQFVDVNFETKAEEGLTVFLAYGFAPDY